MKKLFALALLVCCAAYAQSDKDVVEARAASERWMKLMDTEEYSAAWNASATGVKKEIPKLAWNLLASTVHMPLGELKSRSFKSADVKPSAIALVYQSSYEKNHAVRETVTMVHEADGVWRASGYTIDGDSNK